MINMRLPLWNRIVTQATDSQPGAKVWLERLKNEPFRPQEKNTGHDRDGVVTVDEEGGARLIGARLG